MINKIKKYINFLSEARLQEGKNLPMLFLFLKFSFWIIKNRSGATIFVHLGLHKKGRRIRDIVTVREFLKIQKQVNPGYYLALLEDKFIFDRFLVSFGFPLAELLALIQDREIRWIKNDCREPLENIIHYDLDCFVKMHLNWGGNQVYRLEIRNKNLFINKELCELQHFLDMIGSDTFVVQKTIIQHPEMNRMNASCINSLRIITRHEIDRIGIYEKVLRIGIRGSIVDNTNKGNLVSPINEDGTLFEKATTNNIDLNWITHHPNSQVEFKTFKIPFFQEALDLTKKLHKAFHCFYIIAWDIAITEEGPVIIEGNPLGDTLWAQAINGEKRKDFLNKIAEYKKFRHLK